jgi:hypothetical protein
MLVFFTYVMCKTWKANLVSAPWSIEETPLEVLLELALTGGVF